MKIKLLRSIIMAIKLSTYGLMLQFFCLGMLYGNDSNAQYKSASETYLKVKIEDKTVGEIISIIEENTDFVFYYLKNEINEDQRISLNSSDSKTVADILIEISKTSKLKFRQVNNNISISHISKGEINRGVQRLEVELAEIVVTGRVTSSEDGEGLPGVNVIVKGTSNGTVTDVEGNYSLEVPDENAVLTFSSVGYVSQEFAVGNQTVINVVLATDVTSLDEIVVIGYGSVKKEDVTGAQSGLKSDNLEYRVVTTLQEALAGKMAGVNVQNINGMPG